MNNSVNALKLGDVINTGAFELPYSSCKQDPDLSEQAPRVIYEIHIDKVQVSSNLPSSIIAPLCSQCFPCPNSAAPRGNQGSAPVSDLASPHHCWILLLLPLLFLSLPSFPLL